MTPNIVDILSQALSVLFLLTVPFVACILVGGLLAASIQSLTNIHEPVLGYVGRLLALVLCWYAMSATIISHVRELALLCFRT